MRDESKFWTDAWGQQWPIVQSPYALKFKIPCHAALRRHVFYRDGYTCRHCGAKAVDVPEQYDGRYTLSTNTLVCGRSGWNDLLILDHIVTRKAGGRNVVENLQTLCETCNRLKANAEDKAARLAFSMGADHGKN